MQVVLLPFTLKVRFFKVRKIKYCILIQLASNLLLRVEKGYIERFCCE